MGFLFRMLIFFIFLALGVVFIIYMLYSFLSGTKPERREMQKDRVKLGDNIDLEIAQLVPVDAQELKVLARLPEMKVKSLSGKSIKEGIYKTIYQEPLYSFVHKIYPSGNSLSIIKSSTEIYELLKVGALTKVFINNALFGTINANSQFILKGSDTPKGQLLKSRSTDLIKIEVSDEIVAHLASEIEVDVSINDRVFSLFSKLDSKDEQVFVSLVFHHLLANNQ